MKTLSGGECATNSVSMASSVPALGASSGASGLNVGLFNFTLLCCISDKSKGQRAGQRTLQCSPKNPLGFMLNHKKISTRAGVWSLRLCAYTWVQMCLHSGRLL